MSVRYNLTGAARKALVQTISEILGKPAVYQGAPTFTYAIDFYSVDKNGTLNYPDNTSPEDVRELVSRLRERGYTPENDNTFTVELPRAGFSATALDNLQKIIASKAVLLKKVLGTDSLDIETSEERLIFPWFTLHGLDGEADAYTRLVSALYHMAKNQKRVTAKERDNDNEKFTMRLFLVRLGFIGDEYKTARRILLQNLTGNGSWKSGHAPERTANTVAEAAPAAEIEGGAPYEK